MCLGAKSPLSDLVRSSSRLNLVDGMSRETLTASDDKNDELEPLGKPEAQYQTFGHSVNTFVCGALNLRFGKLLHMGQLPLPCRPQ